MNETLTFNPTTTAEVWSVGNIETVVFTGLSIALQDDSGNTATATAADTAELEAFKASLKAASAANKLIGYRDLRDSNGDDDLRPTAGGNRNAPEGLAFTVSGSDTLITEDDEENLAWMVLDDGTEEWWINFINVSDAEVQGPTDGWRASFRLGSNDYIRVFPVVDSEEAAQAIGYLLIDGAIEGRRLKSGGSRKPVPNALISNVAINVAP